MELSVSFYTYYFYVNVEFLFKKTQILIAQGEVNNNVECNSIN